MAGFLEGIDFSKMADIAPLAIGLDKMGQSYDPNAPFAGVGTFMGQSALANRAMQEGKQERQDLMRMIAQAFGLPTETLGAPGASAMTPTGTAASPMTTDGGVPMSSVTQSLTPVEETGPSKTTTKLDKDGRTVRVTEEVVAKPKKKDQYLDMSQITNLGF